MSPLSLHPRQIGFTYFFVLFAIALMGATLAALGTVWHTAQMRDKEEELLFVGDQFRRAIELYVANSPDSARQFPRELSDMLLDPRDQNIRRYLRQLYRDPMTGNAEWGIVKAPDGGIAGVYSLSDAAPFKTGNFRPPYTTFEGKSRYSDWRFVYRPVASATLIRPSSRP